MWLIDNRRVGHRANRRSIRLGVANPSQPSLSIRLGVANRPSFSKRRSTATTATAPRGSFKRRSASSPTTLPIVPKTLLPAGRLGSLRRCTIRFTSCGTPSLKKLGNKSSACALPLSGIGRISGDAQVHPLFAPRWNGTGGAHGRRCRSFDDNRFFPVLVAAGAAAPTDVKATTAKETGSSSTDGALV